MNLPIGKKSLARIELRGDSIRRVVELTTLLEWLILVNEGPHSPSLKEALALDLFIESKSSYLSNPQKALEACKVRDGLVHIIPATSLPTNNEIENAVTHLRKEIDGLVERSETEIASLAKGGPIKVSSDRQLLIPNTAPHSLDEIRALRNQIAIILGNIDLLEGKRVSLPYDKDLSGHLMSHLERRHLRLGSDSFFSICKAIKDPDESDLSIDDSVLCLKRVVNSLEESLNELLSFESEWQLSPGVAPLNAIRLEPDISARIRLLVTLTEHQLAWIVPHISHKEQEDLLRAGPGYLFRKSVETHEAILPDEQKLLKALDVRNRLVRVIPNRPPLSLREVEEAERTLWQTAYELLRHCHFEHANALSQQPYPGARTKPLSEIRKIDNPKLLLFSLYERLERLVQTWEERNPWLWPPLEDGKVSPSLLRALTRNQSLQAKIKIPDIQMALELSDRIKTNPVLADEISDGPDGRNSRRILETAVALLEKELAMERVPSLAKPHFGSNLAQIFDKNKKRGATEAASPRQHEITPVQVTVSPEIISKTEKVSPPVRGHSSENKQSSRNQENISTDAFSQRSSQSGFIETLFAHPSINQPTNQQVRNRQALKDSITIHKQPNANRSLRLLPSFLTRIKANWQIDNLSYYSLKAFLLKDPVFPIMILLGTAFLFFVSVIIYTAISNVYQDKSLTQTTPAHSGPSYISQADFIRYVIWRPRKPILPRQAKMAGIAGPVIIPACLPKVGKLKIDYNNIENPSGNIEVRKKAINSLNKWKFKQDRPAAACSKITIEFQ